MKTYIKQIWSFFAILSIAFLLGCKEETKVGPLPEPVDLTMDIASNNLAMGESLDITFSVADEKSEIANEDFNIELSLQCSDLEKPTVLFKDFPTSVSFAKGEKSKTISVPVIDAGISSTTYNVTLSAFVRSYKVNNASQLITISDYHRVSMAVKNNSSKEILEGDKFVLTASLLVPAKEDVEVTIEPKSGEEGKYEGFGDGNVITVIIPQGEKSIETEAITLKDDEQDTGDEDLTFELSTTSKEHPLTAESFVIKKIEISTPLGSKIMDERWLYRKPSELFVSPQNKNAVEKWEPPFSYIEMQENMPHPNNGNLPELSRWKFYRAYEFHNISGCKKKMTGQNGYTSERYPSCFADQTTDAIQTAGGCDNSRYGWITDEGYLRMICLKEDTKAKEGKNDGKTMPYGTSAFYSSKFKEDEGDDGVKWAQQNIRIFPGMRIETRARILGHKVGMLPGIWLQGNKQVSSDAEWNGWPNFGEIDVMENNTRTVNSNTVEQTYHFGPPQNNGSTGKYNPTVVASSKGFTGPDNWNIYWVEWIDNETVAMGINGMETIRTTKSEVERNGAKWPFDENVNKEGLYYILSMMFLHKQAPDSGPYEGTTPVEVRSESYNWSTSKVPRLEIDWVRFYIDDTYSIHGKKLVDQIFY